MRFARCAGGVPATSICSVQSTGALGRDRAEAHEVGEHGHGPKPSLTW